MDKDLKAILLGCITLVVLITGVILYSQHDRLDRGMIYIPAHWEVIDENRK